MRLAIGNPKSAIKDRLHALIRSVSLRSGITLSAAMILASGLDYGVNVLAGRWLAPVEYGIFITISAILQVLTYLTLAIRNVAAFYTTELSTQGDSSAARGRQALRTSQVAAFVQHGWRWAWKWGLLATALLAFATPLLARLLHLPNSWPLWAAAPTVLLLFVRSITDGSLQGLQEFTGFGLVQVAQSLLRLLFAAGLVWLGLQAAGAIVALPLAMAVVLVPALWWLRPQFQHIGEAAVQQVSWHYSSYTLLGLASFAVLANMDALFVKHAFSPQAAGNYAPVVTLARISLFIPVAIGILLLPKVKQRQANGEDARPVLFLALVGALVPSLGLTILYFFLPGPLVRIVFTGAYANPGVVLGFASLAASLYAGVNIWMNYALALERPAFIYALFGVLLWQGLGMFLFGHGSLLHMTLVMVSAGALGNFAGAITTWHAGTAHKALNAEIVGA